MLLFRRNIANMKTSQRPTGFTLLELLISISLLISLISMIWALMQLYSTYYVAGTRKADRSQLVRSLSQLLNEDLGAAIQDPVQPLAPGAEGDDSVRRFGLSGSSTSLRIDVVQINPLKSAEIPKTFRPATAGPVQMHAPQAPELKTVYYDFVPLSAYLKTPNAKCGLTRRELDFETPTGPAPSPAAFEEEDATGEAQPIAQARAVGTELAFQGLDPFGDQVGNDSIQPPVPGAGVSGYGQTGPDQIGSAFPGAAAPPKQSIDAELQQEAATDDMWAPEVVDCRFRYGDGSQWFDSWDSLEKNGLPVAIEITFRLMSIEDVETLRQSPLLNQLTPPPTVAKSEETQNEEIATARAVGTEVPLTLDGSDLPASQTQARGWTLDALAEELDLSPPVEQRIVAYLATSPHLKSEPIRRPGPPPKPKEPSAPASIAPAPAAPISPQPPPPKKPSVNPQEWIRK